MCLPRVVNQENGTCTIRVFMNRVQIVIILDWFDVPPPLHDNRQSGEMSRRVGNNSVKAHADCPVPEKTEMTPLVQTSSVEGHAYASMACVPYRINRTQQKRSRVP